MYLGQGSLLASSGLPGSIEAGRLAPIFGLASGGVCLAEEVALPTGGLLHRLFTLTGIEKTRSRRSLFCGTFRRVAPSGCYPASCPAEPGLSSPSRLTRAGAATRFTWRYSIYQFTATIAAVQLRDQARAFTNALINPLYPPILGEICEGLARGESPLHSPFSKRSHTK